MTEVTPTDDVIEAYARPRLDTPARWDEMVDPVHGIRDSWSDIGSALRGLGSVGLAEQRRTVATLLAQDGVTYRPHGADHEQPWLLDPVPIPIDESEWAQLEPALAQRTELLDMILTDLYGPRRLIADGLIPPEVVFSHPGFVRAVDQIRIPAARQLFLSASDLVRGPDGRWVVLADRTQAPSGYGYVMANRRAVSRALTGLYRDSRIQRIGPFFQTLRVSLQALAPNGADAPRIVLLTSGSGSETAFDQAFLSSMLGFPLVEGSDLVARDGHIWQRSIGRMERVDVILRRVDAGFCDPLELRPESQLGVPGLVEACRLGTVSVVNGLGTGVLENPALFPFFPKLSEVLLGHDLSLPSAQTWWCGDPASLSHVLANLDSLVIKPVARQILHTSRFGWELSAAQREGLAHRITADPAGWVGQEVVQASTAPGATSRGLEARPVSLRSFAVADGGAYRILPGGLSRVASGSSRVVVTTHDGALAKDVWVLSRSLIPAPEIELGDLARGRVVSAVSPRVAETLFWLGRYAERAEDVSRLIAVADNRWRDVHPNADPAVPRTASILLHALLEVTSSWPRLGDPEVSHGAQIYGVIGDSERPGSLAHDARRVRELAYASRDQLPTDTWSAFSDLDRVLAPFDNPPAYRDITAAMNALRRSLMAFAGLAAESMVRDSGWYFMDAGRRIERALQIVRLLRGTLVRSEGATVSGLVEESTLIAAESLITHRRRYSAGSGTDTVLDLLLTDRENPRSVAFQLDHLVADLRRISPTPSSEDALDDLVARITARLFATDCATLAATDVSGHRGSLDDLLAHVVDQLHAIALRIEQTHFAHLGTLQQLVRIGDYEPLDAV